MLSVEEATTDRPLNNLNAIEMVLKNETIAYQRLKWAKHTKIGNLGKMLIEKD